MRKFQLMAIFIAFLFVLNPRSTSSAAADTAAQLVHFSEHYSNDPLKVSAIRLIKGLLASAPNDSVNPEYLVASMSVIDKPYLCLEIISRDGRYHADAHFRMPQ